MKKMISTTIVVLLLTTLLSACSGSGSSGAPATRIKIEMTEFIFTPAEMTVYSGQETRLELKNDGSIEHKLTLLKKGAVAKLPFDREKQAGEILVEFTLNAGKSDKFTFILPEAGEYAIVCNIPGHMEAGMVGKLTAVQP